MISTVVMYISMHLAFILLFPFDFFFLSEGMLWPNYAINSNSDFTLRTVFSSVSILVHRAYSNVWYNKRPVCMVLECDPRLGKYEL